MLLNLGRLLVVFDLMDGQFCPILPCELLVNLYMAAPHVLLITKNMVNHCVFRSDCVQSV